jgi:hypothetical protein
MGATESDEQLVQAAANAPITAAQAQKSARELAQMKASLRSWLRFRQLNDQVAAGVAVKPLLKSPRAVAPPAAAFKLKLRKQRLIEEQELATNLHRLLSEVFDADKLPDPDVRRNAAAAVQLAKIAIAGKLPGESTAPDAQGLVWLWPAVVVIGLVAFTIMTQIRSSADVAKEKERIECIKAGACTDTGFFLKLGAVAVIGWLVWDKLGVGKRVMGALGKGGGGT